MPNESAVKIVVPDDFPPALTGSVAETPLKNYQASWDAAREELDRICLDRAQERWEKHVEDYNAERRAHEERDERERERLGYYGREET